MTIRLDPIVSYPLYDTAATRTLEQAALAQAPEHALMERAGVAIARLAAALAPHARHIWIACGQGNNGGDGLEAAVQLHRAGRPVSVSFLGDADRLPVDARRAFERARAAGVVWHAEPPDRLAPQDLCIDALLGIGGASRPAPSWMRPALDVLDRAPCAVLSVDVPSGLDASTGRYAEGFSATGAPRGERHTLTLLTLKPGLFTGSGRDAAGTIWFDDLGVDASRFGQVAPGAWLSARPADPIRAHASHKGSFGDVAVLGGEGLGRRGMGMSGAALLAGSAALHAGAGRTLIALLDDDGTLAVDVGQPELMLRRPAALDFRQGAVVCGCGGGQAVVPYLQRVLAEAGRLVLDADALNAVAADASLQDLLRARAERRASTILTPHPLEAARLLGCDTGAIQADRLGAANRLAERFACVALVKGSGTVLAAPGQAPRVNPTGNARLATAGTGDVLAGMIGAHLAGARTGETLTMQETLQLAADAVYRHGALADEWPVHLPLTAGGLARQAPDR